MIHARLGQVANFLSSESCKLAVSKAGTTSVSFGLHHASASAAALRERYPDRPPCCVMSFAQILGRNANAKRDGHLRLAGGVLLRREPRLTSAVRTLLGAWPILPRRESRSGSPAWPGISSRRTNRIDGVPSLLADLAKGDHGGFTNRIGYALLQHRRQLGMADLADAPADVSRAAVCTHDRPSTAPVRAAFGSAPGEQVDGIVPGVVCTGRVQDRSMPRSPCHPPRCGRARPPSASSSGTGHDQIPSRGVGAQVVGSARSGRLPRATIRRAP